MTDLLFASDALGQAATWGDRIGTPFGGISKGECWLPFCDGQGGTPGSVIILVGIIGVLLALIGFEFMLKSVEQIQSGAGVDYGKAAIIVTVISILVKELMAQFAFWAGRRSENSILKADGWHHRTDALSSVVILIGILCSGFFWWVDGVLGIMVALLIFYASFEILRDSINRLIGEKPDEQLLARVRAIVEEIGPEVDPHHFHLHRYGDHIELTFHIGMERGLTLQEAHDKTHMIELALRERMKIEATIHMEPLTRNRAND